MKNNQNTRKKYTAAIDSALRLLAKAPRTGTELAKSHQAHKAGAQITKILLLGKLVTTSKDGSRTMYRLTERGASRRFKLKPLLDQYFKIRQDYNANYRPKAKPGSQLRSTLLDAAKAATESARPAVVQLSLLEGTDPGGQLFTLTQAIDHLKAKGYKITREL
jgi:DNA-binding PadR family transcriptional regulator